MRKVDGEVINETAHVEDMLSSYNYYNYNDVKKKKKKIITITIM